MRYLLNQEHSFSTILFEGIRPDNAIKERKNMPCKECHWHYLIYYK